MRDMRDSGGDIMLKLIGALLLVLVLPTVSHAAFGETWTNAGSTSVWSASTTGTSTVSAVSGDTICALSTVESTGRTLTVTDNNGGGSNTYTRIATTSIGGTIMGWIDCTVSTGTVTTVTGTLSSTVGGSSFLVTGVITGARSALSAANAATATSSSTTNHDSGTVTITDATAMLIGMSAMDATGGSFTIDTDYTSRYSQAGIVVGSQDASASNNMLNTTGGNRSAINMLIEIRPAAAGASVNFFPRRLQVNP